MRFTWCESSVSFCRNHVHFATCLWFPCHFISSHRQSLLAMYLYTEKEKEKTEKITTHTAHYTALKPIIFSSFEQFLSLSLSIWQEGWKWMCSVCEFFMGFLVRMLFLGSCCLLWKLSSFVGVYIHMQNLIIHRQTERERWKSFQNVKIKSAYGIVKKVNYSLQFRFTCQAHTQHTASLGSLCRAHSHEYEGWRMNGIGKKMFS